MGWFWFVMVVLIIVVLIWSSNIRNQQREAERAYQRELDVKRRAQLESERKDYAADLAVEEDVIPDSLISNAMVVCSNGHRYKHKDFYFQKACSGLESVEVGYDDAAQRLIYQDMPMVYYDDVFGCPMCRSRSWKFVELTLPRRYKKCRSGCGYWFASDQYSECPVCSFKGNM
jgi:hypothetical protein